MTKGQEPREPHCIVGYMDAKGYPHEMLIPESAISFALRCGWSVVIRDSHMVDEPTDIDPAQSSRDIGED